MKNFKIKWLAVVLAAGFLAACGGGGGGGKNVRPDEPTPPATGGGSSGTKVKGTPLATGKPDSKVAPVTVAVYDSGVVIDPVVIGPKLAGTWDALDLNTDVSLTGGVCEKTGQMTGCESNHGTLTTGAVIGNPAKPASDYARVFAVKTSADRPNGSSMAYTYSGMDWLNRNATVRVHSMSFSGWDLPVISEDIPVLRTALISKDGLLAGAAGNENQNLSDYGNLGRGWDAKFAQAIKDGAPIGNAKLTATAYADLFTHYLIVGAIDPITGNRASFSNYPGDIREIQARFIMANGTNVNTVDTDGKLSAFAGTSAATPLVSAVAADLMAVWPHLKATQVASIMLNSADRTHADYARFNTQECGTTSCGYFYMGQGVLDRDASFASAGTVTVPLSVKVDGPAAELQSTRMLMSAAFGDAVAQSAALAAVAGFDQYGRDYQYNLNGAVRAAETYATRRGAFSAFVGANNAVSVRGNDWASAAYSYNENGEIASSVMRFGFGDNAVRAFQYKAGEKNLADMPKGMETLNLLSWNGTSGFTGSRQDTMGFDGSLGVGRDSAIRFGYQHGKETQANRQSTRSDIAMQFSPMRNAEVALGVAASVESGTAAGSEGYGALALGSGSVFVAKTLTANYLASENTTLFARYEQGAMNDLRSSGLIRSVSDIQASQFAFGGLWKSGSTAAALVLSSPLRVDSARAQMAIPVGRTVEGDVVTRNQQTNLRPSGRERNVELALAHQLKSGVTMQLNVAHTLDAGHVKGQEQSSIAIGVSKAF